MKHFCCSFLVLFLFNLPSLWSQKETPSLSENSLLFKSIPNPPTPLSAAVLAINFNTKPSTIPDLHQSMGISPKSNLPATYCAQDLAFFCRLEVQMEKATKIPVRFRLGDVQQVDYLEGKYEGWRYGY